MGGKASKRKGASGEREVATILTDLTGYTTRRKLGAARDGGNDIDFMDWCIEVKRTERVSLPKFWKQAKRQTTANKKAAVVLRWSGEEWLIVTSLKDWIETNRENFVIYANTDE